MSERDGLYLGVDVGTGSARAALFDAKGRLQGLGVQPIIIWRPQTDFVEQSSDDIWESCCAAVKQALAAASARAEQIRGIGFDATCSLVALDAQDRPVTVSPTERDEQNVVVWMDHRAIAQADRINETKHGVLEYVGGVISPEMQSPKLLWLKQNSPQTWQRTARFFDLPDFLTYRATGSDTRSLAPPYASGPTKATWKLTMAKVSVAGTIRFGNRSISASSLTRLINGSAPAYGPWANRLAKV